jgi:serine/threonine protein kinase
VIGRSLAHYRITAAIGSGGMGEVYRATDTRLGRDVALKVLPAAMAASADRLERFRREAKALAALNHPNIVTIYSVEEAGGVHFLTMQLIEGQALDSAIPEGGMPVLRVLDIASALADALEGWLLGALGEIDAAFEVLARAEDQAPRGRRHAAPVDRWRDAAAVARES